MAHIFSFAAVFPHHMSSSHQQHFRCEKLVDFDDFCAREIMFKSWLLGNSIITLHSEIDHIYSAILLTTSFLTQSSLLTLMCSAHNRDMASRSTWKQQRCECCSVPAFHQSTIWSDLRVSHKFLCTHIFVIGLRPLSHYNTHNTSPTHCALSWSQIDIGQASKTVGLHSISQIKDILCRHFVNLPNWWLYHYLSLPVTLNLLHKCEVTLLLVGRRISIN